MKLFYLSVVFLGLVFWGCDGVNLGDDNSQKPVIDKLYASRPTILVADTTTIYVEARDLNEESLDYVWTAIDGGVFVSPNGLDSIKWKAPGAPGLYTIRCRVNNESQESKTQDLDIQVTNVNTPIVQILSPTDGAFFPASNGTVVIHAKVTNVPSASVDSMKFFVDNALFQKVTNDGDFSVNWGITGLNGPKSIKVQAWTRALVIGTTTTDSTTINVSIEGTVSKPNK